MVVTGPSPATRVAASIERAGLSALMALDPVRRWLGRRYREPVEGRVLDPDIAVLLTLDGWTGTSDLRGLTPEQARRRVESEILVVDAPPRPGVTRTDVELSTDAAPPTVRVYTPRNLETPSPAVLFIHGGGWVTGSVSTHDGLCTLIAEEARCRVASVEYRLAPEHRFPAAVDDALAAFRWLVRERDALGVDPERIALCGDSAGGNLSAVVARRTVGDPIRPKLAALLYPALDATCSLPSHRSLGEGYFLTSPMIAWYYDHYLGDGDREHPDASPLLAAPPCEIPLLVHSAGFDPLRDEAKAYADSVSATGGRAMLREHPTMPHGFCLMTGASPAALTATVEIARELGVALRT